jgi:hypothetical protein
VAGEQWLREGATATSLTSHKPGPGSRTLEDVRCLILIILGLATGSVAAEPVRKPSAPVDVSITTRQLPGGYVVTLIAVPTRAVPSIELAIAGKQLVFGPTAGGERRELSAWVAIAPGDGLDLFGGARTANRHKAAYARLGAPKREAAKRTTIRTLPDGRQVEEVRQ